MIVFDTATIEQPLEGANPTLTQEYDEIINRYLARFDKENILARVKVKLIEKLSTGDFQQQDVAKSLGLSIRSLQRKLSAENTSYSELLDQTRHELALSYIKIQATILLRLLIFLALLMSVVLPAHFAAGPIYHPSIIEKNIWLALNF